MDKGDAPEARRLKGTVDQKDLFGSQVSAIRNRVRVRVHVLNLGPEDVITGLIIL
jgi:hypothetical protein